MKIEVNTLFGKLIAEVGGDPDYPEIYVYLKREDGIEIDLVVVSMDQLNSMIKAYIYEDVNRDDYTRMFFWREEDLKIEEEM